MNSAFAVALLDFLQPVILPDAMFHVDHVVADLQVAEVRKKRRGLRLCSAADAKQPHSDSSNRSREPRIASAASGSIDAIRDVCLHQRGGQNFSGEVRSLIGVTLAAARATAQRNDTLYSLKMSASRSTSPVLGAAISTRFPSPICFFTSSSIAGTAPWNRVAGCETKFSGTASTRVSDRECSMSAPRKSAIFPFNHPAKK